jgi:general secretion pathway protein A
MYQRFYGLRELPFELTPNPKYLYLPPKHREALSNLEYGLFSAKSLTVLVGEAGTGKTTLLRAALESERCTNVRCVYLNNPALTRDEFVSMLAAKFALSDAAARSKTALLEELECILRQRRDRGEINALVVDEAQTLSNELLEEIRLLANIETADEKLLPLLLAGQPELTVRLEDPALRQLKQRVALRCEIVPLALQETAAYVATRIRVAGGIPSKLFTREAVSLIQEHSGGIPRIVSVICDNALVSGMALERQPVDASIVLEVCRDFHLRRDLAEDRSSISDDSAQEPDTSGLSDVPPSPEDQSTQNGADATSKSRRFRLFGSERR